VKSVAGLGWQQKSRHENACVQRVGDHAANENQITGAEQHLLNEDQKRRAADPDQMDAF
jgi:hypothetical protein